MKKLALFLSLLLIGFSLFCQDLAKEPEYLTILDFEAESNDLKRFAQILKSDLSSRILLTKKFIGVEKSQIDNVIKQLNFQNFSGLTQEQTSQIGNMTNADFLLLGELQFNDDIYQLNARIIHAESAEIYSIGSIKSQKRESLLFYMDDLVSQLIRDYNPQAIKAQQGFDSAQETATLKLLTGKVNMDFILMDDNGFRVAEGKTPYIQNYFPVGQYKIQISDVNHMYATVFHDIKLTANRKKEFNFTPIPNFYLLNILPTNNKTADVFVDGELLGQAPQEFKITLDSKKLELRPHDDNYAFYNVNLKSLSPRATRKTTVKPEFVIRTKSIKIQNNPNLPCEIKIDGNKVGTTPDLFNFTYGTHDITLEGYNSDGIRHTGNLSLYVSDTTKESYSISLVAHHTEKPKEVKKKDILFRSSNELVGTKLIIDGQHVGLLPSTHSLTYGDHKIIYIATCSDGSQIEQPQNINVSAFSPDNYFVNIPQYFEYEETHRPTKKITIKLSNQDLFQLKDTVTSYQNEYLDQPDAFSKKKYQIWNAENASAIELFDNNKFIGTIPGEFEFTYGIHNLHIDEFFCKGTKQIEVGAKSSNQIVFPIDWPSNYIDWDFHLSGDFAFDTNFMLKEESHLPSGVPGLLIGIMTEISHYQHWIHTGFSFVPRIIGNDPIEAQFDFLLQSGYSYEFIPGFHVGFLLEPGLGITTNTGYADCSFLFNILSTFEYYCNSIDCSFFMHAGFSTNSLYTPSGTGFLTRIGVSYTPRKYYY